MADISKTGQLAKFVSDSELSNYENIAKIIQKNGVCSQGDIIEATKLSKATISRVMKMLRNEGLIILTKRKRGKQSLYQWVGGTPAIEDELHEATTKHLSASLLAETYDSLVTDAFSLFSIMFEGPGWEVITNIKEGLTDTELHQFIGSDVSLDSIRRILVICEAHNLVKISRIRSSAGSDIIRLFEPLYRIESVDDELLKNLILLRGLALAIRFKNEAGNVDGYVHPFSEILNHSEKLYNEYLERASADINSVEEKELIHKVLFNLYDFIPDLDRVYRSIDWRIWLKSDKRVSVDHKTDHILFSEDFVKGIR